MTPTRRHPSSDTWLAWIQGESGESEASKLAAHESDCAGCAALVQTLRGLTGAKSDRAWRVPDESITRRATQMPKRRRTRSPRDPLALSWQAPDVRGGGSAVAEDGRIVARSCPGGELSVLAFPRDENGECRIEGRVWLRSPSPEAILVVLLHEDHVVHQLEATDGETFVARELLAPGWQLEIHFPTGETVVLPDPFHEEL